MTTDSPEAAAALDPSDFFTEDHLRIYSRMRDLSARGDRIDRVTVAGELKKLGQLESGGLGYLVSLDDGLPEVPNLDSYIRIVKDKALLRRIIRSAHMLADLPLPMRAWTMRMRSFTTGPVFSATSNAKSRRMGSRKQTQLRHSLNRCAPRRSTASPVISCGPLMPRH